MGRIGDWPGPSRRTATIILAVLVTLIVAFIVVRSVVPGFGTSEGRHDVVAVGEPIDILVKRAGNERVNMTVTSVERLTDAQRVQWDLERARIIGDEIDSDDAAYLVRFEFDGNGSPSLVPSMWRLVDADGHEYESTRFPLPGEAACSDRSCALVTVPEGVEITMVRYYGVSLDRKVLVGDNWAGWETR